jgi:hypothetical protein
MEYEVYKTRTCRVVCQANWPASDRGCSGSGPRGESPDEAEDLALLKGWERIDGRWVCPAHREVQQ